MEAVEEKDVSIRFRVLGWDASPTGIHFASKGNEAEVIQVPQSFRSPEYQYRGVRELDFFRLQPSPDPNAPPVRVSVATFSLTEETEQWLLVFARGASGETFRVYGMDDSFDRFPYGSSCFFNLTERTLGILFGERKFKLDPGTSDVVDPASEIDKNVQLQILAIRNEELQDIYNTQWLHDQNSRYLVFIKESERRRGRVEIKAIPEYSR